MRRSKQNAIKIARAGIFALTFILAFAIIIAAPIESSSEVALAGLNAQGGTATGFDGNSDALTADNFAGGFPGTGLNTTSWTHFESFSTVSFSEDNVSACIANSTQPLVIESRTGGFKFVKTLSDNDPWIGGDGYQVYGVINYQLSPFLKTLISNTNTTVQVTAFTGYFQRAVASEFAMRVFASSSPVSAASCGVADDVTTTGFTKRTGSSDADKKWNFDYFTDAKKSAITLSSTDNYIVMAFQIGGGSDGKNCTGYVDFREEFTGDPSKGGLTFKVTLGRTDDDKTVINDGAAPILSSINQKAPFRTNNSSESNWNYDYSKDITTSVTDEIKSLYNQNLDRVDANNNVYLHSYVNPQTDGQIIDGKTYYKSVIEEFVDQYSYGSSTVKVADYPGKQYYAGIKSVQVGDVTFGLWNAVPDNTTTNVNTYTSYKDVNIDGVHIGWARIKVIHRSKVQVELYFKDNADVTIIVSDYGDKQVAKTVSVKGIDTQANSAMESILDESKDYFLESGSFVDASSWNQIKWNYNPKMTFDFAEDNVERLAGQSPYMWFYSVVKADSPTRLNSANWTKDVLMSKTPFAVSGLGFTYDFKTGLANGEIGNQTGANATGSGYYLFTFYKMTMSGKYDSETGVRSYYVKVDYEEPVHTLNKSSNGIDLENIDWAAGAPLVITLTQDKANISGNTLTFITMDEGDIETTQKVFVKDGLLYVLDAQGNPKYETGSRITLHQGGRTVYVDYDIDNDGRAVWTITFASQIHNSEQGRTTYINYNYISTFELTTGVEVDLENPITYVDGNWQYAQGSNTRNGVYIRVDRNAPLAPNFMNSDQLDEEYIVEMESLSIPEITERTWYTDGWTFPGQFDFSDDLVGAFGDEIKVYYAMMNITSLDDFANGGDRLSLEQFIQDYEGDGYGHLSTYAFAMYESVSGSKLEDINPLSLALDSKLGAGMRVVLFWTVDQAGNKSELHKYYILADATTYFVTGHIDNGIFDGQTDVTMVGGSAKTAYKRGDRAVIEYAINEDSPYVPYKYTIDNGGEQRETLWVTDNPTSKDVSFDEAPVTVEGTVLTLAIDDNSLGKLQTQSGESFDVYFSFREVVEISVLNNSVYYAGEPASVPFIISNEDAKQYVEYNFDGFDKNQSPTNVGSYKFDMHIDTESYISAVAETMDFFINKKAITISINNSTGVYGNQQTFGYSVDGLVGKDLEAWDPDTYTFNIAGLSLPHANQWILFNGQSVDGKDFSTTDVGAYRLAFDLSVSTGELSSNYTVSALLEARHIITQREIVVSAVNGGKVYGDNDGQMNFTIDTTTLPSGVNSDNITDIIKNAIVLSVDGNIITMAGEALISREAGEDVGEYQYNANASGFDTSANYKVVVDVEGKVFVITKRVVIVTPNGGQEFAYSEANNYSVGYSLDDYRFADALVATWTFAQIGEGEVVGGFEQISMEVGGNLTSNNKNVEFILTEGIVIIVKKAVDGSATIIISKVDGVFNKTYDGTSVLDKVVITEGNGNGFSYTIKDGTLPSGFSIEFTPVITGADVGNYMVVVDGADVTIYDGNNNISSDYTIFVESYTVAITPAVITVAPTFLSTNKTYGQMDSEYGIGYEILANDFDGINFASMISGSFVRAIYQGADLVRYGERYDMVSALDGTFEKAGVAYRYGVAVGNVFTSSNANFAVEVVDLSQYALTISAKEINFADVNTSALYANDKVFNNSPNATFAEGEKEMMFDITPQLVRLEDNVYVDFSALFTDYTAGENKTVKFAEFVLAGEDSVNYILVGADGVVFDVTVNKNGAPIKITTQALVIEKRFFNIVKVYDGTSTITEENIIIDNECMLSGVEFYIANLIAFNGADVTNNFATDIVLMFVGITEDTFVIADESREFISIDQEGLKLSLSLVPGAITPRTIEMTDFVGVDAVDRIYNGKDTVDMTFNLNSKVYGEGDGIGDLGISIHAVADSANVGTRPVTINAVEIASRNYKANFTAEEFTSYVNAKVEIARAVVELNVQYNANKEYNGRLQTSLVKGDDVVAGDGRYAFKLVSSTDMDGNAWTNEIGSITWDFDNVDFIYTVDGQANASVAYKDGEIVRHNVKVSGLTLTSTNPDALSNYEILGYVWNASAGQYEEKSIVLANGLIEDFECLEVAPMAKKTITANNSIKVLPKVYDGTRKAYAVADITTELGVALEDIDFVNFEFDAQFETKNAGEQKVTLRIIGFENLDNAPEDIASNYEVNSATTWVTRQSILPAPMLIEANVGEKTYDGTNTLKVSDIRYTLVGKYATETDTYAVDVLAGHYDDANVFDENGNIPLVKGAKLYGVSLRNLSTSLVNYYPVFASATAIDGLTEITEIGALPQVDSEGNHIYYYEAKTENVYQLTAQEYAEVVGTEAMAHYINKYTRSGNTYYLFKESAQLAGKSTIALAVDDNAVGSIVQREVTMIVEVLNKDVFNKNYDGTSVFHGVAGTDFDISMAAGFVGADGQEVDLDTNGFTVSYSTSKSGVAEIKFIFSDNALAGVDGSKIYLNYTATGAEYIVKGSIKKAQLNAVLGVVSATYGDDANNYDYNINYFVEFDGNQYEVIINGRKGYMLATDYAVVYAGHWTSLDLAGQNALRHNLTDGAFAQDASGQYVVLPDTFSAPTFITNATNQTVIGTYKAKLEGGSATNYYFNFGYSRFDGNASVYDEALTASELVIGKKTLKVTSSSDSYKMTYLGSLPSIDLKYIGFVGNDGTNKIRVEDGVAKFMFFNGAELVDMPANPIPSNKLEDGQYYVAVIDVTKLSADNYVFESICETKLEVVMPEFEGISVEDATVTYNGQSQEGKLQITGNLANTTVEYKYYVGSVAEENRVTEVKNVGIYIVVSTITKQVGEFEQTATFQNTLTIEKANITVDFATTKFDYQEKDFRNEIKEAIKNSLTTSALADKDILLSALEIKFYRVLESLDLKSVSSVEDVDNYVVEVIFTSPTELLEENDAILANYNDCTFSFEFKIVPARIIVTILTGSLEGTISYDEEGNIVLPESLNVVFKYDFAEDYKEKYGLDASDLNAKRFQVQFTDKLSKLITGTGHYPFSIQYLSSGSSDTSKYDADKSYTVIEVGIDDKPSSKINNNYILSGNVGNYSIKSSQIGAPGLSMKFVDGSTIVAPGLSLTVTEITEYVESDELYEYWLAVKSHASSIKTGGKKAELEVIMQLRLMNNGKIVQPGKEVEIELDILLEYAAEEYAFYIVGKDGLLHLIDDYTISEDGKLTFKTSHIDSVVAFHMVEDEDASGQLPPWLWYAVGGGAGLIVLIIIIACSVSASKKKKNKGGNPDGDKPAKKDKEPKQKKEKAPKEKKAEKPAPQPKAAPQPAPKQQAPSAPAKPVAPAQPKAAPSAPAKPVAPAQPKAAPSAPAKPVAPAQPKAAPSAPAKPVTPAQPKAAPSAPAKPVAPAQPKAAPSAPAKPVAPAQPKAAPSAPAKPVAPSAPAQAPARPVAPQRPATPPVVGNKPATPPVVGSKPATPPVVGSKPATPPVVGSKPSTPPVVGKK